MRIKSKIIIFIIFSLMTFLLIASSNSKFEWDPITENDWNPEVDSSYVENGAILLFQKVEANDIEMIKKRHTVSEYKRIRIVNKLGRDYANITIPYSKKKKIKNIKARTIHRNGNITNLKESQIYDKVAFKMKKKKVKTKSFFIPDVSDDCIVEYYYEYKQNYSNYYWQISSELYTKYAEYTWHFYKGKGLIAHHSHYSDSITPNYLCISCNKDLKIEQLPNLKEVDNLKFSINNQKAFKSENLSLPNSTLQSNVRFFYAGEEAASGYWGERSKSIAKHLRNFSKKNKEVVKVINKFKTLATSEEKIQASYSWLQDNILNISYLDDTSDYKDNADANDVIKNEYGTSNDINNVFYDMLRELNIDAKKVWVVDRDENIFQPNAKYWQFDHSYIMVKDESEEINFYNPSIKLLPCGEVRWYNEGVQGLLIGDQNEQYITIPFSSSENNIKMITSKLFLDENSALKGTVTEKHTGQFAYYLRYKYDDTTKRELQNLLRDFSYFNYSNAEIDSFDIMKSFTDELESIFDTPGFSVNVTSSLPEEKDFEVSYNLNFKIPTHIENDKILFRTYDILKKYPIEFDDKERKYPIIFNYANTQKEIFYITISENWSVEALPEIFSFFNPLGSVRIEVKSFDGKTIQIARTIKLNVTFIQPTDYTFAYEFSGALSEYLNDTIIIKKKN
ncbi:MAG: DUF3857 domain-containing protein [Candidatus Cloacimonetes bacterium]|nr:DUF3857 domain-containing protein [Candidatus Cloacimonadota bacterium]